MKKIIKNIHENTVKGISEMKYLNYKDFLKGKAIDDYEILLGQTKDSFLIGPKINDKFDAKSFVLRINSNCIYEKKIYKNKINKNNLKYVNKYYKKIKNNEVYEIYKDKLIIHKILNVPGEDYEKK